MAMSTMTGGGSTSSMDDLYGEDHADAPMKDEGSVDEQEQSEMSTKAVIPMKVAMGKHTDPIHEGDEIVLKVTGVHGDEVEVEYSETPASDIGKDEGEPPKDMSPDDELDGMSDSGRNY